MCGDVDIIMLILNIVFEVGEDGIGCIILNLVGDGVIVLDVEVFEVILMDVMCFYVVLLK